MAQTALLQTPLNALHRRLGARLVDFAGWEMPVQYPSGILAEHQAVRTAGGLFDLSHMGRVYLRGRDALALAQACATRDLAAVRDGEAAYSLLCLPDGGILDDVIVYRLRPEEVLVVVNASNRETDARHFAEQARQRGLAAEVDDRTRQTALIGVQGPQAEAVLQRLAGTDLGPLNGYSFVETTVAGAPALVARTGYTGEDGFEVMVQADQAEAVWERLMAVPERPTPAGLGARDTLRTEAAFALYGHEIDRTTHPFEARLGWVVDLEAKGAFVGRDALAALKAAGITRRLVGLQVAPGGIPRPGFLIVHDGQQVGRVTSGTHSPTLNRGIALGYVDAALAKPGQALGVEMRGKVVPAEVVRLPFVPHRSRPRTPK
jgi:aminomethyltransferase